MRTIISAAISGALLASPATARDWRDQTIEIRPSAFAGARLKMPLGGTKKARPSAQLTIAPARSAISGSGMVTTRVGDGAALDFASGQPQLTLAGTPARDLARSNQKMGISTGAWIGIGVGVAVVASFLIWADAVRDSGD